MPITSQIMELVPIRDNARKYEMNLSRNYLTRSVLRILDKEGFLSRNNI